jgi:hypothetical protein
MPLVINQSISIKLFQVKGERTIIKESSSAIEYIIPKVDGKNSMGL